MVQFIDNELQKLNESVLEMWTLVGEQIKAVCESVKTADVDKAWEVLMREKRVNASDLKIDCDVEDFLVLYNPVAIDLRFVLAIYKINADLERIGDFAESIARFVIKQGKDGVEPALLEKLRFDEMVEQVVKMLETTRLAMEKKDLRLANSVFDMDDLVDGINGEVTAILADYLRQHPESAELALELRGVFSRLERTGDHINNLAEEIVYYVDAEVLKHTFDDQKLEKAIHHHLNEGE